MKYLITLCLVLGFTSQLTAQTSDKAIQKYLYDNIIYPASALDQEIQGDITVAIVTDSAGNVSDVKTVKSLFVGLDKAVKKTLMGYKGLKPLQTVTLALNCKIDDATRKRFRESLTTNKSK